MIIIGIDPGTRFCGYGILEVQDLRITAAGCEVINVSNMSNFEDKLLKIHEEICMIIEDYRPDIAAVESIFYGKNVKTAFLLGHLRGVILFTLAKYNIRINEFSPKEVKKSVVGNGNASKNQVRYMLKELLSLRNMPKSTDASDGLAVALCQFNRIRMGALT